MRIFKEKLIRIGIVVVIVGGLFYASFNVLQSRFKGSERQRKIEEVVGPIVSGLNRTDRLECQSSVYLKLEEENRQDQSLSVQMIHDFKHHRLQFAKGNIQEIQEYDADAPVIYSKGISPVYVKEGARMKKVPLDKWYEYSCEKMYGSERRSGENEMISYGYLTSDKYIRGVKDEGEEEIEGRGCRKYTATIYNTLKPLDHESDNGFRKALGAYGLDPMELKKGYPEVYRRMKEVYDKDSEEMTFWVDDGGKLVRIEKDYTFLYYLNIMKENSEKIRAQVGQYDYPQIICRQDYVYSPACPNIELPKVYDKL